jgi:hypothetical protein
MDSQPMFSNKRYVLVDNELADMIEELNPGDLRFFLHALISANKRQCSHVKGSEIVITAPDGKRFYIVGRLRNKQGGFI